MKNIISLLFGIYFGIVLVKTEVISWFRIQEMFRFDAIHMYGIIGIAVLFGIISVWLIKHFKIEAFGHKTINLKGKEFSKGNILGGVIFGLGWAMTGACPGPLYALIGSGYLIIIPVTISAIGGAFVYGLVKSKLPH